MPEVLVAGQINRLMVLLTARYGRPYTPGTARSWSFVPKRNFRIAENRAHPNREE